MSRANTNAKHEFLLTILERVVKCAEIEYSASILWGIDDETPPPSKSIILKVGYSDAEWEEFLKALDFNYDSGYGSQELYGTVWFEDNAWMERTQYDGMETWTVLSLPDIPSELIK